MTDDYKDTLFLPETDFPMRGNLPEREPVMAAKWKELDLFKTMTTTAAEREKYMLHDGPPFANGNIHMGHAMNKVLKDVVVRTRFALGYNAPLVPGWDCHGLPIEWKIEEKYRAANKNKDDIPPVQFRKECREFAAQWAKVQSEDFQRLGVVADWDNPYLTMNYQSEALIAAEIHKFLMKGMLYRRRASHLVVHGRENRFGCSGTGISRAYLNHGLCGVSGDQLNASGTQRRCGGDLGRRRPGRCRATAPSP